MGTLLIKLTEKRKTPESLRNAYSLLSAVTGIICNVLLCIIKFIIGSLTACVSITADGLNNLSDSAANIVNLISTKLSAKNADKEHPFGHGRIEYISALIVSLLIFIMSFELAKTSVEKIINPPEVNFNIWYVVLLSGTVLVKLWMAFFNNRLFKLTNNLNLKAIRQDSVNDCLVTLATIVALLLAHLLGWNRADGIIGAAVAIFIFISGIEILKSVIGPLLGEAPSKQTSEEIEKIITESDFVLGVHDLIVHNYGVGKTIASAHAEVPENASLKEVHEAIDSAERKIESQLGIIMCIHADPVSTDETSVKYAQIVSQVIEKYNPAYSFHDLRTTTQNGETKLFFDLKVPFEDEAKKEKIEADLIKILSEICPDTHININVEHGYIEN